MNRYVIVAILVIASLILIYLLAKPQDTSSFEKERLAILKQADKPSKSEQDSKAMSEALTDLGNTGNKVHLPTIVKYINDPDPQVSKAAIAQTFTLNPEQGANIVKKELAPALKKEKLTQQELVKVTNFIEQAGIHRDLINKQQLMDLLKHNDARVAMTSARYLIKEYREVDAATNLQKVAPEAVSTLETIVEQYKDSENGAFAIAILCDGAVNDPNIIPVLEKLRNNIKKPMLTDCIDKALYRLKNPPEPPAKNAD